MKQRRSFITVFRRILSDLSKDRKLLCKLCFHSKQNKKENENLFVQANPAFSKVTDTATPFIYLTQ